MSIYLTDVIGFGSTDTEGLLREISDSKQNPIHVYVNSPGGDVFDGMSIMNALRNHDSKVTTHVMGLAGSIASVIVAGASDTVNMNQGARVMIHEPHIATAGTASQLRAEAELLDSVRSDLIDIYAKRLTRYSKPEIENMLQRETWWNADEAVDAGFADHVIDGRTANWMHFRKFMQSYTYEYVPEGDPEAEPHIEETLVQAASMLNQTLREFLEWKNSKS